VLLLGRCWEHGGSIKIQTSLPTLVPWVKTHLRESKRVSDVKNNHWKFKICFCFTIWNYDNGDKFFNFFYSYGYWEIIINNLFHSFLWFYFNFKKMNNYCVQQKKDMFMFQNETHSVQKNCTFKKKSYLHQQLFLIKNDILIQF
jgi:hypothetical protein